MLAGQTPVRCLGAFLLISSFVMRRVHVCVCTVLIRAVAAAVLMVPLWCIEKPHLLETAACSNIHVASPFFTWRVCLFFLLVPRSSQFLVTCSCYNPAAFRRSPWAFGFALSVGMEFRLALLSGCFRSTVSLVWLLFCSAFFCHRIASTPSDESWPFACTIGLWEGQR